MTGYKANWWIGRKYEALIHQMPQPKMATRTATQALHKAYPAIIAGVIGLFVGIAIDWGQVLFTFDNRLTQNTKEINAIYTELNKVDKRISDLEQVVQNQIQEVSKDISSIKTSIKFITGGK